MFIFKDRRQSQVDGILKDIVQRIVEAFDPEKLSFSAPELKDQIRMPAIMIFVLKKGIERKRDIAKKIYRKLFGVGASVDIIVETPEHFNELKSKWFLVYNDIAKTGKVLYEK